jgi:osmotically-inducible protein OsmY
MLEGRAKGDSQIKQDVLQELKWDTRVEETHVGVEVDNGVVTLTGTVSSYAKRLAARDAAHRVKGVLDVADNIQVRVPGTPGHTDTEIGQAVRRALEWDVFVQAHRIQSTVTDGSVTLAGTVEFWSQRDEAARVVRRLAGVRGVTNDIDVKPPSIAPREVQQAIEQALDRRAERAANRIQVMLTDSKVILSGQVGSWQEKQTAMRAAGHAPGVRQVIDKLVIEPSL